MSFSDTYAQEVLESRLTRSQRARFWAKVVSFLLMITVAVVLRSEPQLRLALMKAGMDAVGKVSGRTEPAPVAATPTAPDLSVLQSLLANAQSQGQFQSPAAESPDQNAIKINRPRQSPGPRFQRAPGAENGTDAAPAKDAQQMADQLGKLLQDFRIGQ